MSDDLINSIILFRKETDANFKRTIEKMGIISRRLSANAERIKKRRELFERKMDKIENRIEKLLKLLADKSQRPRIEMRSME